MNKFTDACYKTTFLLKNSNIATDSGDSLARRSATIKPAVLNKRSHGTLLPGMASRRRANAANDAHVVAATFQNTSGSVAAVAGCVYYAVICCSMYG